MITIDRWGALYDVIFLNFVGSLSRRASYQYAATVHHKGLARFANGDAL